jgi:hypothetical protein
MTVRELVLMLSQVEDAIRAARIPGAKGIDPELAAADLASLGVREEQIVRELSSRSFAGSGQPAVAAAGPVEQAVLELGSRA